MLPLSEAVFNLTKDAEVRVTTEKSKLIELSCATNQRVKVNGEWTSRPSYFTTKHWVPKESNLIALLTKGQMIEVQAHVAQERWEKDGTKHEKAILEAIHVNLVGAKGSKGSANLLPTFSGVLNLTRDAEVRVTTDTSKLVELSGASNQSVKENNEWVERPSYFTIKIWVPKESKQIALWVKGQGVHVHGLLVQERWEKDNKKGEKVIVEATDVSLLGSKKEEGESSDYTPPAKETPKTTPAKKDEPKVIDPADISEDEIPF